MKKCPRGTEIVSVVFESPRWTARDARGWLIAHSFKAPKVDRTKNQIRYKQRPTAHFTKGSFKTIDLEKKKGISAIVACPKPGKESDKPKKKNPGKAFKPPAVVVQHGRCVELRVDRGDGTIIKFTWPKTRGDVQWLLTDAAGKRLFVCPWNKVAVTDAVFEERLNAAAGSTKAIKQWSYATGKPADVGSVIKVPERKIGKIGRAVSIVYYFDIKHGDGSPREHVFESSPLVRADSATKPKLIVISGGDLEVTREGIEG